MAYIDTEKASILLREKAIDLENRKILITNFTGSDQEKDLLEPANCNGFGRIRHFKLTSGGQDWPQNPLPILPANKALAKTIDNEIRAQVFQNSVCNWRCWYCFVDFELLSGNKKHANFLSSQDLLDLYLDQENPPLVIDLTGGQPDLTPEWVPWMMEALKERGLENKVYLWSDDNLSNDFFWRFLSQKQIETVANYKMYSRVCCFKGIDADSFSLNTKADPLLFSEQFELSKRLIDLGIDLYFYITLTASSKSDFKSIVPQFLDKAQKIHELLPLKIVPLKVFEFTPVKDRMNQTFEDMLVGQSIAIEVWKEELGKRFDLKDRMKSITEIVIN